MSNTNFLAELFDPGRWPMKFFCLASDKEHLLKLLSNDKPGQDNWEVTSKKQNKNKTKTKTETKNRNKKTKQNKTKNKTKGKKKKVTSFLSLSFKSNYPILSKSGKVDSGYSFISRVDHLIFEHCIRSFLMLFVNFFFFLSWSRVMATYTPKW